MEVGDGVFCVGSSNELERGVSEVGLAPPTPVKQSQDRGKKRTMGTGKTMVKVAKPGVESKDANVRGGEPEHEVVREGKEQDECAWQAVC